MQVSQEFGRGTSLGFLAPLGKGSTYLEKVGLEVLDDQWHGMASHKLGKYSTVSGSKIVLLSFFGGQGSSISWKIRIFLSLGLKVTQAAVCITTNFVTNFVKALASVEPKGEPTETPSTCL